MSQYTLSYTGEEVNNLLTTVSENSSAWDSISQVPDRIVDQGISGVWQYVKYESGIAMCWNEHNSNSDYSFVAWGNGYTAGDYNAGAYPFTFTTYPAVFGHAYSVGSSWSMGCGMSGGSASTAPSIYAFRPSSAASTPDIGFRIFAIGKWK